MDELPRKFDRVRISSASSERSSTSVLSAIRGARPRTNAFQRPRPASPRQDEPRRATARTRSTELTTPNNTQQGETPAGGANGNRGHDERRQHFENDRREFSGWRSRPTRGTGRGGSRGSGMYGGRHSFGKDGNGSERPMMLPVPALRQLIGKEAAEIVMYLRTPRHGFINTINANTLDSYVIQLLVRVLAKACDCPMSRNLVELLNDLQDSPFLAVHVTGYINRMPTEKSGRSQEEFPDFLRGVVRILQEMFQRLPSSYDNLLVPLASLQVTVQMLKKMTIVDDQSIETGVEELTSIRDDLMTKERTGSTIRDQQAENLKGGNSSRNTNRIRNRRREEEVTPREPPNNFREMSIYPESQDVLTKDNPFVRPNIVRGTYQNLEHYLDVQFRLYREDFLAPLRQGIDEYINQLKKGNVRNRRIQDIRVYTNVEIIGPVCTNQGLFHTLQFDISRLKRVNWEFSKRLIFGAFLCLSNDDFKSLYFATVGNRSARKLERGMIDVKFVGGTQTVSRLIQQSQRSPFTMVETSAYFEAYHHVLKGLQNVQEDELPFEQYFIHCRNQVEPPNYLRQRLTSRSTRFDLTPIMECSKSLIGSEFYDSDSSNSDDDHWLSFGLDIDGKLQERKAEKVPILELQSWPSAESLGLDTSQLSAVKTALTKEISVIQGPPGTGKTYIGLKIAHALLHNRDVWGKDSKQPLLVVCYTNHALDQFLEGIHKFQKKGIVRAGSRSSSEVLKGCMLSEIKHRNREDRVVPRSIYSSSRASRGKLKDIETQISGHKELMDNVRQHLLNLGQIHEFMENRHYQRLDQARSIAEQSGYSILHFWLGVAGPGVAQFGEVEGDDNGSDSEDNSEDETKTGNGGGADRETENSNGHEAGARVDTESSMLEAERFGDTDVEVYSTGGMQRPGRPNNTGAPARRQVKEGEWAYVDNKKKVRRRIRAGLSVSVRHCMRPEEARRVDDVWQLSNGNRWRLYRHWVNRYTEYFRDCITELEKKFEEEAKQLEEINFEEDLEILKGAVVIGMTTTGAARYRSILQRVKPKIIIVEEAAEVLEAHVITTLTSSCEQLILIGDHKQLRPNPTVYKLARDYNLDYSLFERMVANGMHCDTLGIQHRMRPEIAVLMDHIYDDLENHESVYNYENVKGVASNVYFIDHNHLEIENEELLSHANEHEARYVTALCRYFLLQGYEPSQVTVLTTYKGQLFKLKGMMKNKHIFDGVRVTAVDNFQGEENDIIILSLVRSNKAGKIGFLATENRACVALSRARVGFYCIGNISLLANHSTLWRSIKDDMTNRGHMGRALSLHCQNHPNTKIEAKSDEDFRAAPEGGCTLPCGVRLQCGHVCVSACHPGDPLHKKYKCRKPCVKTTCELKHKCPKRCYEDCGPCMTKLDKVIPRCGHTQEVPCSVDPEDFVCLEACTEILTCGHRCQNICGVDCTSKDGCRVTVTRIWPCGHEVETDCRHRPENYPCPAECEAILGCEHPCVGTCGKCKRGRLHVQCRNMCGRTLVCSHECTGNCTSYCPPCTRPCTNHCAHSSCRHQCGFPCKQCTEPCEWNCQHHRCTKLCGEPCDRPPCNQPCRKYLQCGHQCIGLCGEPCPTKCRVCHREEVTEIFFGAEDEPGARFVQLEDCDHVIEVKDLDKWMELKPDKKSQSVTIQLKKCPKCNTPIRKNLRYGHIIKQILADIGEVKQRILGEPTKIAEKAEELKEKVENSEELGKLDTEQIENLLVRPDYLTTENVHALENQVNYLEAISKLKTSFSRELKEAFESKPGSRLDLRARIDMINFEAIVNDFTTWLMSWKYQITEQALQDATTELSRLNLMVRFHVLDAGMRAHKLTADEKRKKAMQRLSKTLDRGDLMSPSEIDSWSEYVKKVHTSYGVLHPLSREMKAKIISAMGLSKGHWYKCPNGHYYAIGDCGGANQISKCPDCGLAVGGTSHALAAGNQHAPEIDGSEYPAYSDAANMDPRNFDLNDFM